MKTTFLTLMMAIPFVMAVPSWAQEEEDVSDRPRRDGEMRERMIEEFDADGDGKLSDDERQTARETMRERRSGQGRGPGQRPGQGRGRGGEDRRAPTCSVGRPPDPNQLFDEFDADEDGQLSRDEFMKLTEAQRDRRPPRPPRDGRAGGPRPGGPGRDDRPGSPPERREFDRQPPLQNQVGPPRGDEPRGRGRGGEGIGPGPRGPEGRGPEGRPGPDPNRMFDRFDENGDDQLSRDEFMKLSDGLREMRDRMGEGGRRGGGPRGPSRAG